MASIADIKHSQENPGCDCARCKGVAGLASRVVQKSRTTVQDNLYNCPYCGKECRRRQDGTATELDGWTIYHEPEPYAESREGCVVEMVARGLRVVMRGPDTAVIPRAVLDRLAEEGRRQRGYG